MPIRLREPGIVGGLRTPEAALLVAGRQRLAPGRDDDVEIPLPQPVFVLRAVDHAHVHGHAEALQRGPEEQHETLGGRVLGQELDAVRLAGFGVDQLGVLDFVTGIAKQRERLAQIVAVGLLTAADRIGVGLAEEVRRHLVLHALQDFEFLALRNSGRRQFGAFEITGDTFVLAEENRAVHLLEVEGEVEGAAYARVLELVAPDVEGEGLHHAEIADREFLQHHLLVAHGRKIVGGRPILGAVLGAPIDLIALEGLQRDGGIAEIFEADLLEIIAADVQVEILAPIVGDFLIDDRVAGREILDPVGARAERRLQRGLRHVALFAGFVGAFPPVLRQHRQLTDDLRQFAVARSVEHEGDFALGGFFRLGHVPVIGAELRTVLLERVERENHVLGRHRLAVVPMRIGAQAIGDRRAVRRVADRFRQQAIFGRYLVERRRAQRFGESARRPWRGCPSRPTPPG